MSDSTLLLQRHLVSEPQRNVGLESLRHFHSRVIRRTLFLGNALKDDVKRDGGDVFYRLVQVLLQRKARVLLVSGVKSSIGEPEPAGGSSVA